MNVGDHLGLGLLRERELISSIARFEMGSYGLSVLHGRGGWGGGHDLGLCGLLDDVLTGHFEDEVVSKELSGCICEEERDT